MENASKALIIAGGVLLAMLILSIGVYLISNLGGTADTYVTELDIVELNKYNSNFEVFIGRNDITAQEIVTLIGIAQQKEQGTQVYLILSNGTEKEITNYDEEAKNKFLVENIVKHTVDATGTEHIENLYKYISINYDSEGRVSKISFKKSEPL